MPSRTPQIGHILRRPATSITRQSLLEWNPRGKTKRERPVTAWMQKLSSVSLTLEGGKKAVKHRNRWKAIFKALYAPLGEKTNEWASYAVRRCCVKNSVGSKLKKNVDRLLCTFACAGYAGAERVSSRRKYEASWLSGSVRDLQARDRRFKLPGGLNFVVALCSWARPLPTRALSRPRSTWVPGRTGKVCVFK